MGAPLFSRLSALDTLTPTERTLARYFEEHYPRLAFDNLDSICGATGVSTASVTRFARRLGYVNFKDFSAQLKAEVADNFEGPQGETPDNPLTQRINDAVSALESSATSVDPETFDKVCELIGDETKPLFLVSTASGGIIFRYLSDRAHFFRDGITCLFGVEDIAQHLIDVNENSVVLVNSFDDNVKSIRVAMDISQQRGATVCLITNKSASPLRNQADYILYVRSEGGDRFNTRAPLLVLIEALIDGMRKPASKKRAEEVKQIQDALDLRYTI